MMEWSKWFIYDESSPSYLRWKVGPTTKAGQKTKVKAGDVAGCRAGKAYSVRLHGVNRLVHRIVYEMLNGLLPEGMEVDHVDGDAFNNVITNLRMVTPAVNKRNRRCNSNSVSGIGGVFRCVGNPRSGPFWRAVWTSNGKQYTKSFTVSKYGESGSYELAKARRDQEIHKLNEDGAGYTERHGK